MVRVEKVMDVVFRASGPDTSGHRAKIRWSSNHVQRAYLELHSHALICQI